VLEHLLAVLGVQHLGVPLHPGQPASGVLEGGHRRGRGAGEHVEALGSLAHGVPVGHPHPVLLGDLGQQRARTGDLHRGAAVLRETGAGDLTAEDLRHRLEAVAHAEHGHAGVEEVRVHVRGTRGVDRGRPPGEDDGGRLAGQHLRDRHRVRNDLGVDPGLADAPGDQLGVLGSEVDDENEVVVGQDGALSATRGAGCRVCQRFF
jgi:hypothetical protein